MLCLRHWRVLELQIVFSMWVWTNYGSSWIRLTVVQGNKFYQFTLTYTLKPIYLPSHLFSMSLNLSTFESADPFSSPFYCFYKGYLFLNLEVVKNH